MPSLPVECVVRMKEGIASLEMEGDLPNECREAVVQGVDPLKLGNLSLIVDHKKRSVLGCGGVEDPPPSRSPWESISDASGSIGKFNMGRPKLLGFKSPGKQYKGAG